MSGLLLDHHLATFKTPNVNCADGSSCQLLTTANVETKNKSKGRRLKIGKRSNYENLPPKWALRAAVKVAGVFSPRMDADLESSHPRLLSPLCSTAQTIRVSRNLSGGSDHTGLDGTHSEPSPQDNASLVNDLNMMPSKKPTSKSADYAHQRKVAFYDIYDARDAAPCFDPEAEYTFEFLQHLIDYRDLSLDLGKVLGKVRLGGALRGQPIRFMAGVVKQRSSQGVAESCISMENLDCIWSFDLWHKLLMT